MTTTTLPQAAVAAFAASVRAALDDLPRDEVAELTEGLEADLADRAKESGSDLGDPLAYADELRQAAGLPPRRGGWRLPFVDRLKLVREHPRAVWVLEFLRSLAPVWWVLRGWLAYLLLAAPLGTTTILPTSPVAFAVLVATVVLSVQIGRGRLLRGPSARVALIIINTAAIVATPLAAGWIYANQANPVYYEQPSPPPQGLTSDGMEVTNIFAYGPDGKALTGVQLFDQNGDPLDLVGDPTTAYTWNYVDETLLLPSAKVPGRAGWNVVPLQQVPNSALDETGQLRATASPRDVTPPFSSVQPLVGQESTD